jgi:hypothetical protein
VYSQNMNLIAFASQILFGANWYENSLKNYRAQNSPLIAEILKISEESEQVMKIGVEKYAGFVCDFFL